MKITTKTIYAIRAMHSLNIAYEGGKPVGIASLSKKLDISAKYLEQIFSVLRKNSLVTSTAGKHGGYTLTRKGENISILDIVSIMDGGLIPTHCVNHKDCTVCKKCTINGLWMEMKNVMENFLSSVTLESLKYNKLYPVLGCPPTQD